jgi:hypothetical protein
MPTQWRIFPRCRLVRGLTSVVVLGLAVLMASCVSVQPAQLGRSLGAQTNAEEYRIAALLYQQESARLQVEAQRYQQEAMTLRHEEDPKGYRRAGLLTAATETRKQAAELHKLAGLHHQQALTVNGQLPQESQP